MSCAASTARWRARAEHPWIKVATGSWGRAGGGQRLGARQPARRHRSADVLPARDGECSEGSVWEAAQFASSTSGEPGRDRRRQR